MRSTAASEIAFHDYQREAIDFVLSRVGSAVFADPGLGKTAIALQCIAVHRVMRGTPCAVVTPLRPLFSTWPQEIERWSDFHHLDYQICHGKHKTIIPGKDLYLVNPEGLEAFCSQPEARKIGFLIVDESSKFKNNSAKRTKLIKQYAKRIHKRVIMTGTPAPNGMLDLFSQMFLVDLGASLGTSYTRFRSAFFMPEDYNEWSWVPKPLAREALEKLTAPSCLRLDGEKLLSLPDFVYRDFHVALSPVEKDSYDKIEKKLFAELETSGGKLSIVQGADSAYMKCRQIAGGFLYRKTIVDADGRTWTDGEPGWIEEEAAAIRSAQQNKTKPAYGRSTTRLNRHKLELLRDLVDELQGKPVAVVYNFDEERQALQAEFRTDYVIGAGCSAEQGARIVEKWNRDEIPMLLLHPASASHGINLQHGSGRHVIWYSLTDDLEAYQQLNRRIRRQGVTDRVFIYHLVCQGTVDEAIASRLGQKAELQASLLDALEAYRACSH
jgi:SNF2 family DNA or RNA helicase